MKTRAVRMYGKRDLRLEEFELPEIKEDEILAKIITDSICMSTWKLVEQGKNHKRAPQNIDTNPIIIGHEFSGIIMQVGKKWENKFKSGMRFTQQPALNYHGSLASPGYSYEFFGGDATYCIFPHEVMELGAIMEYGGENFYEASLGEPMSCIVGAYHANYHTNKHNYNHAMGTKQNGNTIILGGCGPMGLGAVSYGIHFENTPKRIIVTDINDGRIARAEEVISPEYAAGYGIELQYLNTAHMENPWQTLMDVTEGHGYDDVFVYAPVRSVAELGNRLLAFDGCMNFFSGPQDKNFSAMVNLYDCHYTSTHIMGTTGGNNDDLIEANRLAAEGIIQPAVMVTHVGGLDSVAEVTLDLPKIPGGKKLAYTHIDMPMTAIEDFEKLGDKDQFFIELDKCCKAHNGLWNGDAEKMLLKHFNVELS